MNVAQPCKMLSEKSKWISLGSLNKYRIFMQKDRILSNSFREEPKKSKDVHEREFKAMIQ